MPDIETIYRQVMIPERGLDYYQHSRYVLERQTFTRCRAIREQLKRIKRFWPEKWLNPGQNLALTVLYAPTSHDIGLPIL